MSSTEQPGGVATGRKPLHDLSRILVEPADIPKHLPRLRHEFGGLSRENGRYVVRGWAAHKEGRWTSADLYFNGKKIQTCEPHERADVTKNHTHIPNIEMPGFEFWLDEPSLGVENTERVDVVIHIGEKPVAWVWTPVRSDLLEQMPLPPPHLMKRVIGTDNPGHFLRFALTCLGQYLQPASRHRDLSTVKRMLDWGCGCGRVTAQYLRIINGPEVSGCDIDGEDIAWCKENVTEGKFEHSSPYVPLPYETGSFDLVVSLSVLTHLTKEQQFEWMREISRILAPGGLFVASVHGVPAADWRAERFLYDRLMKEGFYDDLPDNALAGIAPEGYYRNTYQNEAYTRKSFGKVFDVLEFIEAGVGIQDLVVARKRDRPKGLLGLLRGQ